MNDVHRENAEMQRTNPAVVRVVAAQEECALGQFSAPVTGIAQFSTVELFRRFEHSVRANVRGLPSEEDFQQDTPEAGILSPGTPLPTVGIYAHQCLQDFISRIGSALRDAIDKTYIEALMTGVHTAHAREKGLERRRIAASASDLLSRPTMTAYRKYLLSINNTVSQRRWPVKRGQGLGGAPQGARPLSAAEARAVYLYEKAIASNLSENNAASRVAEQMPELFVENGPKAVDVAGRISRWQEKARNEGLDADGLLRRAKSRR